MGEGTSICRRGEQDRVGSEERGMERGRKKDERERDDGDQETGGG